MIYVYHNFSVAGGTNHPMIFSYHNKTNELEYASFFDFERPLSVAPFSLHSSAVSANVTMEIDGVD